MGNYALRHDKAAVAIRTLTTEKKDIERKTDGFYRYLLPLCYVIIEIRCKETK